MDIFASFSLVQDQPRDLQLSAYKYDTAHALYCLADFKAATISAVKN